VGGEMGLVYLLSLALLALGVFSSQSFERIQSVPVGVEEDFDCQARALAYECVHA